MKYRITKYLLLLAALSIATYSLIVKYSFTATVLYSVIGIILLHIIASVLDNLTEKTVKDKTIFAYFTPGLVTKKIILIGAFTIASIVLLISGSKVLLFGLILLSMLITEIAALFIKINRSLYYIYFDERAIVLKQENFTKIFASHISEISYRHGIIYLTLTNNKVQLIEPEKINRIHMPDFMKSFIDWANKYEIPISAEAKEKLNLL